MTHPENHPFQSIHALLCDHFGPLAWWPAESPFEVVVGTILTQNTDWTNVERAIANLKQAQALSPGALAAMSRQELEEQIRPSGYFRQKAARLQSLATHLVNDWRGDLAAFCDGPLPEVRNRLLDQHGIGPETADSILLYAAERPSFVVDTYTRRVFSRVGLIAGTEAYEDIRKAFMDALPEDVATYNEYHAQIVQLAKNYCRKSAPLCRACPLADLCRHAGEGQT